MAAEPSPSNGRRERDLFVGALEKANPADRAAYLDAACGSDLALRGRLDDLLRGREEVGGFLEQPAVSAVRSAGGHAFGPGGTEVIAAITEKPGDRIGRYKLLQKIGEGGAGAVYMAEQEEPVRRRVALKVIKLGMDTKSVIARFEAERQALAMMDHPNIAKVFDAGATDTGRPFFVMELVRGIRITDYCDQNNLPTEERLKLLIQVCQAIQHAHQKGIIHRDIKPSNILVTLHDGVPVPKVIDFGIAKATGPRLTDKTLFTEFTMFIGTPAYMSPEQAEMSGLDIDTRSDIYALGVLLYELLTGKTPFDPEMLMRAGVDECRRTLREEEPVRPSTRLATMIDAELTTTARQRQTEAPKLIHLLSGDLDWIAMKCLEKDRTRRFATTNDLVLDIQRYLDGEPVLACPPSRWYRFQKFVRRNRPAFAATTAVAFTLLSGAALSVWLAVRATRAEHRALSAQQQEVHLRQQAERERIRAEQEGASARLNEYVASINLAQRSLAEGNLGRAVQLLDKHRPAPGEADLRGFEWRYLWQLCQGDEHTALPNQGGVVHSLAVSPDGGWLAVGLQERCNVWDLRTRSLVTNLPKGGFSVAFLPDGQRLLTASASTVRVWRMTDWTEQTSLPAHSAPAVLSRDASRLATQGRDGIHLLNTATWKEFRLLPNAVGPMAFSPDGQSLVTDSRAGLTVWTLEGLRTGLVLQESTNLARSGPGLMGLLPRRGMRPQSDRAVVFSPDGKWVIAARNMLSKQGVFVLGLWDAESGQEAAALPPDPEHIEHTDAISAAVFSPDGKTLATASLDHSIRLWDFAKRQRLEVLQGHRDEVWAAAFSPDGQTLVSGAKDGSVKLWPLRRRQKEDPLPGTWQPLAFSKDSRTLAAHSRDGGVVFLNLATGEPDHQFQLDRRRSRFGPLAPAPALSADLRTMVEGLDDGTVKLWDTETRDATTFKVSDGAGDLLVLSPDARTLITRGRDWALRRWDLRNSTNDVWPVGAFKVLFSPDGRKLATQGREDVIRIWDAVTLANLANLDCEQPPAFGLTAAFSSDGRFLAVAYQDDAIRLWDLESGRMLGPCLGHKQGVSSIAFSPDGKTLATASDDSTLRLWNVATQQELLTIRRLGGALRALTFSPDGGMLVGGGSFSMQTGGLRFYRAPLFSETDASFPATRVQTERP